jgi:hypothetical protein
MATLDFNDEVHQVNDDLRDTASKNVVFDPEGLNHTNASFLERDLNKGDDGTLMTNEENSELMAGVWGAVNSVNNLLGGKMILFIIIFLVLGKLSKKRF